MLEVSSANGKIITPNINRAIFNAEEVINNFSELHENLMHDTGSAGCSNGMQRSDSKYEVKEKISERYDLMKEYLPQFQESIGLLIAYLKDSIFNRIGLEKDFSDLQKTTKFYNQRPSINYDDVVTPDYLAAKIYLDAIKYQKEMDKHSQHLDKEIELNSPYLQQSDEMFSFDNFNFKTLCALETNVFQYRKILPSRNIGASVILNSPVSRDGGLY